MTSLIPLKIFVLIVNQFFAGMIAIDKCETSTRLYPWDLVDRCGLIICDYVRVYEIPHYLPLFH